MGRPTALDVVLAGLAQFVVADCFHCHDPIPFPCHSFPVNVLVHPLRYDQVGQPVVVVVGPSVEVVVGGGRQRHELVHLDQQPFGLAQVGGETRYSQK